jgi:hypothetical protein
MVKMADEALADKEISPILQAVFDHNMKNIKAILEERKKNPFTYVQWRYILRMILEESMYPALSIVPKRIIPDENDLQQAIESENGPAIKWVADRVDLGHGVHGVGKEEDIIRIFRANGGGTVASIYYLLKKWDIPVSHALVWWDKKTGYGCDMRFRSSLKMSIEEWDALDMSADAPF